MKSKRSEFSYRMFNTLASGWVKQLFVSLVEESSSTSVNV